MGDQAWETLENENLQLKPQLFIVADSVKKKEKTFQLSNHLFIYGTGSLVSWQGDLLYVTENFVVIDYVGFNFLLKP